MNLVIFIFIVLLGFTSYYFGRKKAYSIQATNTRLTALPQFYGYYLAIWCAIPAFIIYSLWAIFEPSIVKLIILSDYSNQGYLNDELNLIYEKTKSLSRGQFTGEITPYLETSAEKYLNLRSIAQNSKVVLILTIIIASIAYGYKRISSNKRTREPVEKFLNAVLFTASLAAVLTTVGIVFSLIFQTIDFFKVIPLFDFIFGTHWYPAKAFVRDASETLDPSMYSDTFGAVPIFAGTFFIAFIAMCVAIPIGLMSGIYLAEYASTRVRQYAKPLIEILAGIPTVVYGFFAALTVGPFLKDIGTAMGLEVSAESALAAGGVMGIMIIPFISSLSDDVITSVPQGLRDGSYAMGATKSETIKKVIFPAALPGIVGSILLGVSRAIGETMIVVMASGLAANLTLNPLESTSTITAQIVVILIGDQAFGDPKTQAAFALGMTLFLVTLCLNIFALRVVKNIEKNMNKNKEKLLNSRYRAEKRFQFYGKSAIFLALLFLTIFIFKIFSTGYTAFQKTWLVIPVTFDAETLYLDENPSIEDIEDADYFDIALQTMFDLDKSASEKQQNDLKKMTSYFFEREIKGELLNDPSLIGKTKDVYLTASDDLDQVFKGNYPRDLPEDQRRVTDYQLKIFDQLVEQGRVESKFNLSFFTYPDSREAELAGIASSFMGSIFSILVCLVIAFPVAVLAAIYLEEFAPKNKFTDFIEVNINNLAAVPSIVFGLLGLGILLAVFQLPRSTPLVGGITLSLMTLPTIIIACRASLKAVPPSIREAALAMGASRMQTTMHHTVPLSMPGTLSGTIIGLAQALGETAPLILIGMVAFVNTIPGSPLDPAASLPVQIYIWAESAERGFVEKVSACIMVLLGFLILMNLFAQIIRHKFEKKWS